MITQQQKENFCEHIKNSELLVRSVAKKEDILLSMKEVLGDPHNTYAPVNLHTVDNISSIDMEQIGILLEKLAKKTHAFFKDSKDEIYTQEDIDRFIFNSGKWFVRNFNKVAHNNSVGNIEFGKAQKLLNMTLKYMACFSDSNEYENIFKYAHMPIDSIILGQMKNRLKIVCISDEHNNYHKFQRTPWSSLSFEQYKDILLCYRGRIRENLEYSKKGWLEIEFDWWEKISSTSSNV